MVLTDVSPVRAGTKAEASAFFWLTAFYVVYCTRPEDWIPGLFYIPLAKITAICALWGLYKIGGLRSQVLRKLPIESTYLLALIATFYLSGFLSPVWRGGAVSHAIDFSKSYIVWLLTFLLVTNFNRFRRVVYIQAASVAVIALISYIKGHSLPRIQGVLGGIYSNPNDLAFAIVLSLPFCLAFLITAKGMPRKLLWVCAMLMMGVTLVRTASRSGFIDLMISWPICLWYFGVKGKRFYLVLVTAFVGIVILAVSGGTLKDRILATAGQGNTFEDKEAYGSFEARKYLMVRALEGIEQYPVLGVGINNFITYSGIWHEVHMSYLQIAVEGGIPAITLYLLFFSRGFANLRKLRKMKLQGEPALFVGALHSSLIGFVVGALFSPEGYQFFPYFTVGYTSALLSIMQQHPVTAAIPARVDSYLAYLETYASS